MKITLEGTDYNLDIEKAKSFGVLTEARKPITDFSVGDVFRDPTNHFTRILIIESFWSYRDQKFDIAGNQGLKVFSNFNGSPKSKTEMLDFLNESGYEFVKNINAQIAALIES